MSDYQYHKGTALYGRCLTVSTTKALLCMADVWLPVPQRHCSVWPMSDCQYHKGTALYGRCLTISTTRALLCMANVWLPVPQGHCSVWPMSDCQYHKGTAVYGRCLTASTTRALLCMADVWLPVPQGHCSVWPMRSLEYRWLSMSQLFPSILSLAAPQQRPPRWPSGKVSASKAAGTGIKPRLPCSSHVSDWTAWRHRVSAKTGQPGVSILVLHEIVCLIPSSCLNAAAQTTVFTVPSLGCPRMLLSYPFTPGVDEVNIYPHIDVVFPPPLAVTSPIL